MRERTEEQRRFSVVVPGEGVLVSCVQEGEGPIDVVFLHGLYDRKDSFLRFFFQLMPREGYRFTTFDNPGSGESERRIGGTHSIKWLAEVAFKLFSVLGIESACLYGMSLGAFVAAQLAREHPEFVDALFMQGAFVSSERIAASSPIMNHVRNELIRRPRFSRVWLKVFTAARHVAARKTSKSLLHIYGNLMNEREKELMGSQPDFLGLGYENVKKTSPFAAADEIESLLCDIGEEFFNGINAPTMIADGENPSVNGPFDVEEVKKKFSPSTPTKTLVIPGVGHYASFLEPKICLYSALAFFAEARARKEK